MQAGQSLSKGIDKLIDWSQHSARTRMIEAPVRRIKRTDPNRTSLVQRFRQLGNLAAKETVLRLDPGQVAVQFPAFMDKPERASKVIGGATMGLYLGLRTEGYGEIAMRVIKNKGRIAEQLREEQLRKESAKAFSDVQQLLQNRG